MRVIEFGDQSATLVTHAERPDLEDQAQGEDFLSQWPTFMFHDPFADEHYPIMYERCPEFQFSILDDAGSLLWTGLNFSTSGEYVVDGALAPVVFDADADLGVYIEPNVWMLHRL